jgi:hypothetical protein
MVEWLPSTSLMSFRALFGKRTFLVRHGRKATCRFAAVGWIAGSTLVRIAAHISEVLEQNPADESDVQAGQHDEVRHANPL